MAKGIDCKKIRIEGHSLQRMFERNIKPGDVINTLHEGKVIKEYPDDKPYPSFLILKFVQGKPVHVVVAKNDENGFCFVITVYEPDPKLWSADYKNKIA